MSSDHCEGLAKPSRLRDFLNFSLCEAYLDMGMLPAVSFVLKISPMI